MEERAQYLLQKKQNIFQKFRTSLMLLDFHKFYQQPMRKTNLTTSLLLHKFILYLSKTAAYNDKLEGYKRQLASMINSHNYVLPFSALDVDSRGSISQANLQLFLIHHKHFIKPVDINRYFMKYVHGQTELNYEYIMESLLPHGDYILLNTTRKNIIQSPYHESNYLCKRAEKQVISQIVAMIVSTEIAQLKSAYIMMEDLSGTSFSAGAALWRQLDRNHTNCLTYQIIYELGKDFRVKISESIWKAFINWHFRSKKNTMDRADLMIILEAHQNNKRNGSDCNYEIFVQTQISQRKTWQKQINMKVAQEKVVSKIFGQTRTSQSASKTKQKNYQKQVIDPEKVEIGAKRLLYNKIGYQNPTNLIKMSQVI